MTFALNVIAVPQAAAVPSPLTCTHVSPVRPASCLPHCLSVIAFPWHHHYLPRGLHSDCWLVVPGDLRPVSMPPEYNWMAEAKEPSMGKRGSRGTHTQTHLHTKKMKRSLTYSTDTLDWCCALLHIQLYTSQLILWLSMVVWLCEDTYLLGMYLTERQVNINAKKLHLYSPSGNESVSMLPILTSLSAFCSETRSVFEGGSSTLPSESPWITLKRNITVEVLPFSFAFSWSLFRVFFSH